MTASTNWTTLIEEVFKAHATRRLAGRLKWRGLHISLEHQAGGVRRGRDADGKAWETHMKVPYGYVRGTEGEDGDHLDCFVREDGLDTCQDVFVVHTVKPGTREYDEDKCFIGFTSSAQALACFRDHYDNAARHFGALSVIPAGEFVAHCQGGPKHDHPLVAHARTKVLMSHRRIERVAKAQIAAREERRDWLRALAAQPAEPTEVLKSVSVAEKSVALLAEAISVSKATPITDGEDRLILIEPGFDVVDPQGDWIPLSTIAHAWAYYERSGNIDLEHISKKGGKSVRERANAIADQGFTPDGAFARLQYEIGRPVRDSIIVWLHDGTELKGTRAVKAAAEKTPALAVARLRYVGRIYRGNEAADWFWRTWTEQSPPMPWRPSVAGTMFASEVLVESDDPVLSIKGERVTRVARRFLWNNTAMTLEPVNHLAPDITAPDRAQLRMHNILKGVMIMEEQNTVGSLEVIKGVMLRAGLAALEDMADAGQVTASEHAQMVKEVSKSVEVLSEEVFAADVSKSLSYGAMTTDVSALSQGGAATGESFEPADLSDFRRELIAREFHKATIEGYSPVSKAVGYEPPSDPEEYLSELGDCVQQNYACNTDDALLIAQRFVQLVLG